MAEITEKAEKALRDRASTVDNAVAASQGSLQDRDTPALSEPVAAPVEQTGTGTDNTAANKAVLLKQLDAKIAVAVKAGNTKGAEKLRARRAALEGS